MLFRRPSHLYQINVVSKARQHYIIIFKYSIKKQTTEGDILKASLNVRKMCEETQNSYIYNAIHYMETKYKYLIKILARRKFAS